uniref:Uncharacterized protein n=1 Tax=Panagrolaimus sp. JU765 TaxID=591449 RepID=A0AC34R4A8_9BILA
MLPPFVVDDAENCPCVPPTEEKLAQLYKNRPNLELPPVHQQNKKILHLEQILTLKSKEFEKTEKPSNFTNFEFYLCKKPSSNTFARVRLLQTNGKFVQVFFVDYLVPTIALRDDLRPIPDGEEWKMIPSCLKI